MKFLFSEEARKSCRIKVIGVGGGGGNALNRMIDAGLNDVEFIACNTDLQALSNCKSPIKVQLGAKLTHGLGSGGIPEIGRKAAQESLDELKEVCKDADMVFITCGMGGGTGTGASPIIAELAREGGALTIGVITKPFDFEGKKRSIQAEEGIRLLREKIGTAIVIPNQRLLSVAPRNITFADAFKLVDNVLLFATRGISELITEPGLINLDFADVKTIMSEEGDAMMGMGRGRGDGRAEEAAEAAINCPLLEDGSISGAKGLLVNVKGGTDFGLYEVNKAMSVIRNNVERDAHLIFGATINKEKSEEVDITVIATGIEKKRKEKVSRSLTTAEERKRFEIPALRIRERDEKVAGEKGKTSIYAPDDLEIPTFIRRQMD